MAVETRESWSGKIGFVLAAAGSAIGLGNIWKFPYITGMNGGGAFVLVYLGCILVFGLPLMLCETAIGRKTGKNPYGAFKALQTKRSLTADVIGILLLVSSICLATTGHFGFAALLFGCAVLFVWLGFAAVGLLSLITAMLILSYYAVVGAWIVDYVWRAFSGGLHFTEVSEAAQVFGNYLDNDPERIVIELVIFMLTSLNDRVEVPLTLLRGQFDLVDNHTYFDHQQGWGLPVGFRQQSAVKQMAVVPVNLMPSRIFGKPYIVTEFNYCNPNIYRAEGGSLVGAYAGLQNWDAVFRFAWSHSSTGISQVTTLAATFDINSDPLAQLSDRIAMTMFLRNDVDAAKEKYAYEVSSNVTSDLFQNESMTYPENFVSLGLIAQTGSVIAGKRSLPEVNILTPEELRKPESLKNEKISQLWQRALKQHVADSATGQIALDVNQCTFAVKTPRSESITLERGACRAGIVCVENADSFQTVGAISLDGKELGKSSSILVIHLTNIAYTGMHFKGEDKKTLVSLGTPPLLVYRGTADLTLSSDRNYKVVALSADGEELGPVNISSSGSNITFKLDPGCYLGGVIAYHLTALQE